MYIKGHSHLLLFTFVRTRGRGEKGVPLLCSRKLLQVSCLMLQRRVVAQGWQRALEQRWRWVQVMWAKLDQGGQGTSGVGSYRRSNAGPGGGGWRSIKATSGGKHLRSVIMNCFTRAPPSGPSFPWTSTLTGAFLSFDCRPSHGVGELLSERLPGIAAVLWNAGESRFIADAVILLIVCFIL